MNSPLGVDKAHWVTGFCDRSASFGLTMYKSNHKWYFKVVFEVLVDLKDLKLLEELQTFFGVGRIYQTTKNATFRVGSVSELMVIIDHFTNYPLISPKLVTFTLWSEVVRLIHTSQHLVPETFSYIQSVYAALGRGASKAVMQAFPTLTPLTLPTYTLPVAVHAINPWWISGYLTLYGTFDLKIETSGWGDSVYHKFRHVFSVGFDIKSQMLAEAMAEYLGLVTYVRNGEQRIDMFAQSTLEATNLVYFFNDYPLQSYKNDQFIVWKKFVESLQEEREAHVQRKEPFSHKRFNYYSKLIDQLNATKR